MEIVVILALSVLSIILTFVIVVFAYIIKYQFWKRDKLYNIYSILCDEPNKTVLLKTRECLAGDSLSPNTAEDNVSITSVLSSTVETNKLKILDNLLNFNESFLKNQKWAEEISNLMPHCLSILKLCQNITKRLVSSPEHVTTWSETADMPRQVDSASEYYESTGSAINKNEDSNLDDQLTPEQKAEVVTITRAIGPRVDDVVRAMYPPLDPRLLEARLTSLYLAVCHLVYVTRKTEIAGPHAVPKQRLWLKQSIQRIEDNLEVLRKVSLACDACIQLQNLDYAKDNFTFNKCRKSKSTSTNLNNIAVISL